MNGDEDVVTYFYDDHAPVRVVVIHAAVAVWWVAADVCAVLDLGDVDHAISGLDDADRIQTPVGDDEMWIVTEFGLYELISKSGREARPFRRWIGEVLPAIRRSAMRPPPSVPSTLDVNACGRRELIQRVLDAEARAQIAEAYVDVLAPAAAAWTRLAGVQGGYSLRDAAHILTHAGVPGMGQTTLTRKLRDLRWIDPDGRPYQRQIETGRITVSAANTAPSGGRSSAGVAVLITPTGLFWLLRHLAPPVEIPPQREPME